MTFILLLPAFLAGCLMVLGVFALSDYRRRLRHERAVNAQLREDNEALLMERAVYPQGQDDDRHQEA